MAKYICNTDLNEENCLSQYDIIKIYTLFDCFYMQNMAFIGCIGIREQNVYIYNLSTKYWNILKSIPLIFPLSLFSTIFF